MKVRLMFDLQDGATECVCLVSSGDRKCVKHL